MRKYLQYLYPTKVLFPECIQNSYNSMIRRQTTQLQWSKDLNGHSVKEETRVTNKHVKRLRDILISEVQTQITGKHYRTPTGMPKTTKSENPKYQRGCKAARATVRFWWEWKIAPPRQETVGQFLRKLNPHLPYNPAFYRWVFNWEEWQHMSIKRHTQEFLYQLYS